MGNMRRAATTQRSSNPYRFGADFSFYVPPPEGEEIAAAQEVLARLFQRARSSIEHAAKRSAAVGKVLTDWRAALDDQVGLDSWRRFIDYSRKQRTSRFGLEDYRPSQIAPDVIATAKKEARKRSLELLAEANVDREVVQKIHARAQKKLLRSLGPPDTRAPKLEVVREEEVPRAIRKGKTNPWFLKTPPYDGWHWNYAWENSAYQGSGGTLSLKHNIEILEEPFPYISGQFGHYSRFEDFSASDWDVMWLNCVSEVGFWYKPAQTGKRTVWVKIRCKKARADIYLDDEYGGSFSRTQMWSRLRLDVVQVPGLEGQTEDWDIHVEGSPDSTWYNLDWIAPEAVLWLPFVANFPPGWVYVAIGADDQRFTRLNDVSTDQTMDSRYLVEEVWIGQ